MVLRLTSRSPRRPGFVVTVVCEYGTPRPGWVCAPPQDLTPASARQNHTTSPSAESIVRLRAICQLTGLVDPPCHPLTSPDAVASTASRPAFVTTRDPPLCGTGWRDRGSDLGQTGNKIFLQKGLDSQTGKTRSDLPVRHPAQSGYPV